MWDKDNAKANVLDVDKSYEEMVAWRDDPSWEIKTNDNQYNCAANWTTTRKKVQQTMVMTRAKNEGLILIRSYCKGIVV